MLTTDSFGTPSGSKGFASAPSCRGVISPKDYHRPDNRHEHAVEIQPGYSRLAEGAEDKTTHNRTGNAEHDVEEQAFTTLVDDFAANEPGDEAEYKPADDGHNFLLLERDGCPDDTHLDTPRGASRLV